MTDKAKDRWVGIYYPEPWELLTDWRVRATLCPVYDSVVAIFPGRWNPCGGSCLMGFPDCPQLEDAEVIELREQEMKDLGDEDGEVNLAAEEQWQKFMGLHTTALALDACQEQGAVPITANPKWRVPAQLLVGIDAARTANVQAAALAAASVDLVLPEIGPLTEQEILQARDMLRPQLQPFRAEMLRLAPLVREGLARSTSLEDVAREARYVAQTRVAPTLTDLRRRALLERGPFWRRLFVRGISTATRLAFSYVAKGPLLAAIEASTGAEGMLLEILGRGSISDSLIDHGGLGYLLAIEGLKRPGKAGPRK